MGMFSFEGVSSIDRALIQQFVEKYYHSLSLIKSKKYEEGKRAYADLLDLFKQINTKDSLAEIHKQLAYNCVRDVYSNLSEMEVSPLTDRTFKTLLSVTIIILLIGLLLILKPNVAGMFGVELQENSPVWTAGVNMFIVDSITKFNLDEFFSSSYELGYEVKESRDVDLIIANNILVVIPNPGFQGITEIKLVAYNREYPDVYTMVPLKLAVQ